MHYHDTCANLIRDGRVMVSMISPPDVAGRVRPRARKAKEEMETDKNFAIFEIDIEEVKKDMAYKIVIDSGIEITAKDEHKPWYDAAMEELEAVG